MKQTFIKFGTTALCGLILLAASAWAEELTPWQKAAVELLLKEPKIKDAVWIGTDVLWISIKDDGTPRDGYAGYVCLTVGENTKVPDGTSFLVEALDLASIAIKQKKVLGQHLCQVQKGE